MNFVLILFNLRDEELNAEKTITVKNVSYCSYEKRAWKNFRASLGFEPPALCDTLLSQKLKNYATPFVFSFLLLSSLWLHI